MRRILWCLLLCVLPVQAAAQTYYVAQTGGDNTRSCATAENVATPRQTIASGLSCLNSAGDVLLIRAGTYDELIQNGIPSGSGNNQLGEAGWVGATLTRIANYNGETVWVRPSSDNSTGVLYINQALSYIEFDGINIDGTNIVGAIRTVVAFSTNAGNNPHHIRFKNAEVIAGTIGGSGAISLGGHVAIGQTGSFQIQNVTVHGGGTGGTCGVNCSSNGIYIKSPNNLIENNTVYDNANIGIQIYNPGGTDAPSNNIIRNNTVRDQTRTGYSGGLRTGILIGEIGANNQVYNNVIYNIGASGAGIAIDVGSGTSSSRIWNNTIYNAVEVGIAVNAGASNTDVRNNIVYSPTYPASDPYRNSGTLTVVAGNLGAPDAGWINDTPDFVDAGTADFQHLAGSPAIDAGSNNAALIQVVTTDFEGTTRPQGTTWDIGAYEFTASAAPPAVNITAPTSQTTYGTQTTPLTTLAGTCTDTDGTVSSVTWSNSSGGSGSASLVGGGTASATWSVSSIVLASGDQTITVTCTDNGALTHQDTLTVTYTPPGGGSPTTYRLRIGA